MPSKEQEDKERRLNELEVEARQKIEKALESGGKGAPETIDSLVDTAIDEILKSVHSAECGTLLQSIIERRSRLNLASGSTSIIIGICGRILAFGIAGVGLGIAFARNVGELSVPIQKGIALASILAFEFTFVSLMVLLLYLLRSRFRYPFLSFKKISNTWPHFYYASISPETPRFLTCIPSKYKKAQALYAADFVKFSSKVVAETPEEALRVELQQYFLLIAYQGYSQQFSLQLANLFIYGFVGSLIAALAIGTELFYFIK